MNALVHFLRDTGIYLCLVYLYMHREMTVADFVFYISLTASFSGMLSRIAEGMQQAYKSGLDVAELTDFLHSFKEADRRKGKKPLPQEVEIIEFINVSYHYPGSSHLIIDHLNLKLSRTEKTGVVGLNGAGKTTLALLLCGLLTPAEGRILLNGINITEFDSQEYIAMFSAVFQEISVLPMTIADNIALGEADLEHLKKSVEDAGLTGLDLQKRFIREIYPDAVSLSGGEMQKLALARAIYKPSKCLILDEPTASLDPVAEQNLYHHYSQFSALPIKENIAACASPDMQRVLESVRFAGLPDRFYELLDCSLFRQLDPNGIEVSGGEMQKIAIARARYQDELIFIMDEPASSLDPVSESAIYENIHTLLHDSTVIFISHRLSSCKFCDRILVMEEGNIIQQGRHEELLRDEGGRYAALWNAQARYYQGGNPA